MRMRFLSSNREGKNEKASRVDWRRHKKWWPDPESNWGHRDFQSLALPTELSCHLVLYNKHPGTDFVKLSSGKKSPFLRGLPAPAVENGVSGG